MSMNCFYCGLAVTAAAKSKKYFFIAPFLFFYYGRRSSRPKGLPKWRRNRRCSSRFYGAIEALLYDPLFKIIEIFNRFKILYVTGFAYETNWLNGW